MAIILLWVRKLTEQFYTAIATVFMRLWNAC